MKSPFGPESPQDPMPQMPQIRLEDLDFAKLTRIVKWILLAIKEISVILDTAFARS